MLVEFHIGDCNPIDPGVLDEGSHALDIAPLTGVGIGVKFTGVLEEGSHAAETASPEGVGIGVALLKAWVGEAGSTFSWGVAFFSVAISCKWLSILQSGIW